jgi:hypothetical protein
MAKRMLCLFLAVSFLVCCAGCNGKKTDESPVSYEPVIGEEAGDITKEQIDGVTFVHEKYLLFEVEYPLLECSIQSEEKIKDFNLYGYKSAKEIKVSNDDGSTTTYDVIGNNIRIPDIFEKEEVSSVKYTLYNFAGGIATEEYQFDLSDTTYVNQYSVEIAGGQQQTLYLYFFVSLEINPDVEADTDTNDYKERLSKAVIKAEVNYADGDAQVVYFAVRQKYETSQTPVYLELYTLTLM